MHDKKPAETLPVKSIITPEEAPVDEPIVLNKKLTPDETVLKKYEKFQLEQMGRDFEAYMAMKPAEIQGITKPEYLSIFEHTGLPQVYFDQLAAVANTVQPMSVLNNRLREGDNQQKSIFKDLDRKLNYTTYRLFFRENKTPHTLVRKWYSLLGAQKDFPELEAYKARAATLLLGAFREEDAEPMYQVNFGEGKDGQTAEYDKRQLAAELLLDAGFTATFEAGDTTHLKLYLESAKALLRKACFENNTPAFDTASRRRAAAMLQETIQAEFFFRTQGFLDADEDKITLLRRLKEPNANLLYAAFDYVCQLPRSDRDTIGERNELAVRILAGGASETSKVPSLVRGAFEREDRPYEKAGELGKNKTSADMVMYVFDSQEEPNIPYKIPFQVKGHYNPKEGESYGISTLSLSASGEIVPTLQMFISVLQHKRPGSPNAIMNNFGHFFRKFLYENNNVLLRDMEHLSHL